MPVRELVTDLVRGVHGEGGLAGTADTEQRDHRHGLAGRGAQGGDHALQLPLAAGEVRYVGGQLGR